MKITSERVRELADMHQTTAEQCMFDSEFYRRNREIATILRWAAEVMQAETVAHLGKRYVGDLQLTGFCKYGYELIIKPEPPEVPSND